MLSLLYSTVTYMFSSKDVVVNLLIVINALHPVASHFPCIILRLHLYHVQTISPLRNSAILSIWLDTYIYLSSCPPQDSSTPRILSNHPTFSVESCQHKHKKCKWMTHTLLTEIKKRDCQIWARSDGRVEKRLA